MFDIGFGEMVLLAAIALIAIGPKQLPEVARTLGRMLNELRKATGDLTKSFTDVKTYVDEVMPQVTAPFHEAANKMNTEAAKVSSATSNHEVPALEEADPNQLDMHSKMFATTTPAASATAPAEEQLSFALSAVSDAETKKGV